MSFAVVKSDRTSPSRQYEYHQITLSHWQISHMFPRVFAPSCPVYFSPFPIYLQSPHWYRVHARSPPKCSCVKLNLDLIALIHSGVILPPTRLGSEEKQRENKDSKFKNQKTKVVGSVAVGGYKDAYHLTAVRKMREIPDFLGRLILTAI